MDPVTQGVLGATVATVVSPVRQRKHLAAIACVGALAGMAPDLDVLFWSPKDPLLFLDYHRHFTHSLAFVPIGALIVAAVLYCFYFRTRQSLSRQQLYLYCLIGYGTHGLLDCFTTYGTSLLWPFSDARIAWNWISVVDPGFTVPTLLLLWFGVRRQKTIWLKLGSLWMLAYLSFGWIQHQRAMEAGVLIAENRAHTPQHISVKPAFGSLLLWKSIYKHGRHYYVDAVRTGFTVTLWPGDRIPALSEDEHLAWLDPNSQQARDLERFRHFSNGYLAWQVAEYPTVTDIRYSMIPNETESIWGIRLKPDKAADEHIDYFVNRRAREKARAFWRLLTARPDNTPGKNQCP